MLKLSTLASCLQFENFIDPRSIVIYIPQRLPELQEAAGVLEKELPVPVTFEAKVEICFATWLLSQKGHETSTTVFALRTDSSKGVPQSWQTNSKIGIYFSLLIKPDRNIQRGLITAMLFFSFRCANVKKVTNSGKRISGSFTIPPSFRAIYHLAAASSAGGLRIHRGIPQEVRLQSGT